MLRGTKIYPSDFNHMEELFMYFSSRLLKEEKSIVYLIISEQKQSNFSLLLYFQAEKLK